MRSGASPAGRMAVVVAIAVAVLAAWPGLAAADVNESADRPYQAGLITGGIAHGCALSLDGNIRCWGLDANGQLGDGVVAAPTNNASPRGPVAVGQRARAIAAGFEHTCAIRYDRAVVCWGIDIFGELGDGAVGSPNENASPRGPVALGQPALAISAGGDSTCALLADRSVRCWGYDGEGEIGDGTVGAPTANPSPKPVPLGQGAKAIVSGDNHTCAILLDGSVRCWGLDFAGQLGDGTIDAPGASATPAPVVGLTQPAVAISAGNRHTCVILSGGGVRCWGGRQEGQVGDGVVSGTGTPVPQAVALGQSARAIASGNAHVCVVLAGNSMRCWGSDAGGQLGDGLVGMPDQNPTPIVPVGLGEVARAITAGNGTICGLLASGRLRCWGADFQGQIGDGDPLQSSPFSHPVELPPLAGSVGDLSLSLAGPATATVGDAVALTVTARNGGPDAATATIAVPLGPGLTLESAAPSAGGYAAGSALWTVQLAAGATSTLRLNARATGARTTTTTADVLSSSAADPDSLPGNGVAEDDHAAASTTIAPAPVPPRKLRINVPVGVTWALRGNQIALIRMIAPGVPKGTKARVTCAGKKCPFKRKASKKRRKGNITLFKEVSAIKALATGKRNFRGGQRVELRLTKRGFIGQVVRYRLKTGKIPTGRNFCLPVGAKKPRKRC